MILPALFFLDFFALLSLLKGSWSAFALSFILKEGFSFSLTLDPYFYFSYFAFLPLGKLSISSKLGSDIRLCLLKFVFDVRGLFWRGWLKEFLMLEEPGCLDSIFMFSLTTKVEEDLGMFEGESIEECFVLIFFSFSWISKTLLIPPFSSNSTFLGVWAILLDWELFFCRFYLLLSLFFDFLSFSFSFFSSYSKITADSVYFSLFVPYFFFL